MRRPRKHKPERIVLPSAGECRVALGLRLTLVRLHAGDEKLSQEHIGRLIGASQSQYSRWEKGDRWPDPRSMVVLCQKFRVTLGFLYSGSLSDLADSVQASLDRCSCASCSPIGWHGADGGQFRWG